DGRQSILTRNQVSAIALAPGSAYPASCLPFYVTDYPALSKAFAAKDAALADNLRMPPDGVPEPLQQAAKVSAETVLAMPGLVHGDRKASVDEMIAARIAAELDKES
ncbi:CoA-transferase, partial [Mesorhizobium sp. M2D.F.Ca.ET.160.01.1.1]